MKFYVDAIVELPDQIEVGDHVFEFEDCCEPPCYYCEDLKWELLDIKDGVIRVYVDDKTYFFELDASRELLQKTIDKATKFAVKEAKKSIKKGE